MKITFLGTGTSHGVPSIDCMRRDFENCPKGVCRKAAGDPKHNRTRSSILVETAGKNILVDVSPDFRQQSLRERIVSIDAVLITHCHADHIGGIPDIRSYTREKAMPVYGSGESMDYIRKAFPYIFFRPVIEGGGIPDLELKETCASFNISGIEIIKIPVTHGNLSGCCGYRIGPMAYLPDCKEIPAESGKLLEGVSCLIIDSLRDGRPHSTHLTLDESMKTAMRIKPEKCYFIHMGHLIDYETDSRKLEPWMAFSYDGMNIVV